MMTIRRTAPARPRRASPATPLPTIMKSPRTSTGRILAHRSQHSSAHDDRRRRRRARGRVTGLHRRRSSDGDGLVDDLGLRLDAHGVGAERFFVVQPARLEVSTARRSRRRFRRRTDPASPTVRGTSSSRRSSRALRIADQAGGADRGSRHHRGRRRRHRRHGGLRRGHASCAASRWCRCRRRCSRRSTAPSAARWASTIRSART